MTLFVNLISFMSLDFCLVGFRVSERSVHVEREGGRGQSPLPTREPNLVSCFRLFSFFEKSIIDENLMSPDIRKRSV